MAKLQISFVTLCVLFCGIAAISPNSSFPTRIETFSNPILDFVSPDPQVLFHNGFYYLVLSSNIWPHLNGGILLYKSSILTDFNGAQHDLIYAVPKGLSNLWAPELHEIGGEIYIYFAMDDGNNDNHRMYVIKANDPNNLFGGWSQENRLYTTDFIDHWAIDGTILKYPDNKLYFIWSGWPSIGAGSPQNLYIAPMSDPMTISGNRVLIREPKFDWEGPYTLEGPYGLQKNERTFLVFSAHSTWGPDYCLGIMGIDDFKDPLVPENWWNNDDGCVFSRNDDENVFCTGHAAFTTSPDGSETWVIFHATNDVNDPGTRRIARVEKITWDENDYPIFPRPSGDNRELQLPSGQIMETYEGTVLDTLSADPASILIDGFYYLTLSTDTERQITVHKSPKLTDFRDAEKSVIYQTSAEYENAWASELHMVDGGLYLYFTQNRIGEEHRMYVMKAVDPSNPMGDWGLPTRLFPEQEIFSIDGSILNYDGKIYYVFCSVDEGVPMSIYIAPMSDPMTISGPRVLLRSPHSEWDTHGGAVNEGPYIVQNNGRTFLVFSGSSTWTPDYCLGMMGIESGKNPLNPQDWWDDLDECQFYKNPEEGIYCTGHAAFTYSPDITELWMLYHATDDPNSNEQSTRIARAIKVNWAEDHAPTFLRPTSKPLAVPSGQRMI